jgi:hypothetical protein
MKGIWREIMDLQKRGPGMDETARTKETFEGGIKMNHKIKIIVIPGRDPYGYDTAKQAVCSCGWKSRPCESYVTDQRGQINDAINRHKNEGRA